MKRKQGRRLILERLEQRQLLATRVWDSGGSNGDWNQADNWSPDNVPGNFDTAAFENDGSATEPGEVTNFITSDTQVGGLRYTTDGGRFHTTNLGGNTLTVNGPVSFNTNKNSGTVNSLQNGTLIVNAPFANIGIARSLPNQGIGTANLQGLAQWTANVSEIIVGDDGNGNGQLILAQNNTIEANEFAVSRNFSNAQVSLGQNASLSLGSDEKRGLLAIAKHDTNQGSHRNGIFDVSKGQRFDAKLDSLTIGFMGGGAGGARGDVTGARAGDISIGTEDSPGQIIIGQTLNGGDGAGNVDLSRQDSLVAHVDSFIAAQRIGLAGSVAANIKLPQTNQIHARTILLGDDGDGTMELGDSNVLLAESLTIGRDFSNFSVTGLSDSEITLGSSDQPLYVSIGAQDFGRNSTRVAKLDLASADHLNANLGDVIVGQKRGANGTIVADFFGATGGTITIGTPQDRANFLVADTILGGDVLAQVDFSKQDELNAFLDQFTIGVLHAGGLASGEVSLPDKTAIDAKTIIVGHTFPKSNFLGNGQLHLGADTSLLADELVVGRNFSRSVVDIPANSTLKLGSAERPLAVSIANQDTNTNSSLEGRVDLTGADVEAFFGDILVGRKIGGPGRASGEIIGGRGHVTVGSPETPASFVVGQNIAGGTTIGIVDWSGYQSLTAHLDQWIIGQNVTGAARGTIKLPDSSDVSANTILIADSAFGSLELGTTTQIQTNRLTLGRGSAGATIKVPAGGLLAVGSQENRVNTEIGRVQFGCNCEIRSHLDGSGGVLRGYFDEFILGEKDDVAGNGVGILTVGNDPMNLVDINTLTMAIEKGRGTLNIHGGEFSVGRLERGTGIATVNWTGGRVRFGQFATQTNPLSLVNDGHGVLAPGLPVGKGTIFGDYQQSNNGVLEIELGGVSRGVDYDVLDVAGTLALGGELEIKFTDSGNGPFRPSPGDSFDIFDAETTTGVFDELTLPALPTGLQWNTDLLNTEGTISVELTPGNELPDGLLIVVLPDTAPNDVTVRKSNSALEVIDVNGGILATEELADITKLILLGAPAVDDSVTVDFNAGGFFAPPLGIEFDGGFLGNDRLIVIGTGDSTGGYMPSGSIFGDGTVSIVESGGESTITFTGLEPVEVSHMKGFDFLSPNGSDTVNIDSGQTSDGVDANVVTGTSDGVSFESLIWHEIAEMDFVLGHNDRTGADSDTVEINDLVTSNLIHLSIHGGDGSNVLELPNRQLELNGELSFDGGRIVMNGGTFSAANVELEGGSVQGFGVLDAPIIGLADAFARQGDLVLGNGNATSVTIAATLDVSDQAVTLSSDGFTQLGSETTIARGGTLNADGIFLPQSAQLIGTGNVFARIATELGSTIETAGDLTLGDEQAFDGYHSNGSLNIHDSHVIIQDADSGVLGSATTIGNTTGGGSLSSSNGLLLGQGRSLAGYGTVHGEFENQGNVAGQGPNDDDLLDFTGTVTGSGTFEGNIQFSGAFSPGNSPGRVAAEGRLSFGDTATFHVEIGGKQSGIEFDRVELIGNAVLGGKLDVDLLDLDNGYEPKVLDTFEVLTFDSVEGQFDTSEQVIVAPGLQVETLIESDHVDLVFIPQAWQNVVDKFDVNISGSVEPVDILLIINELNSNGSHAMPKISSRGDLPPPYFDVDGDDIVAPADALLVINFINAGGATAEAEADDALVKLPTIFAEDRQLSAFDDEQVTRIVIEEPNWQLTDPRTSQAQVDEALAEWSPATEVAWEWDSALEDDPTLGIELALDESVGRMT